MGVFKIITIVLLAILCLDPLCAEFTKGKVTKVEENYFIISAGSFRRARSGNLFWAYRVVSGRRIKVGLVKVNQVYYDSSKCSYNFLPPVGYVKLGDSVSLARFSHPDNYSVEFLKDSIKSKLKQDQWDSFLESCVELLLKKTDSAYARYMLAHYFLRYGLYSSSYNNLKAAEKLVSYLEPYERLSLYNLLGILEFRYRRRKTAMTYLDKVINFKFVQVSPKTLKKVPVLDIDIFDEEFVGEKKQAVSIYEKLIENKLKLGRAVGALLKGFILEADGYGVFSELILSNVDINREVLEESAEVIRYFPAIKDDFVKYVETVISSKVKK